MKGTGIRGYPSDSSSKCGKMGACRRGRGIEESEWDIRQHGWVRLRSFEMSLSIDGENRYLALDEDWRWDMFTSLSCCEYLAVGLPAGFGGWHDEVAYCRVSKDA